MLTDTAPNILCNIKLNLAIFYKGSNKLGSKGKIGVWVVCIFKNLPQTMPTTTRCRFSVWIRITPAIRGLNVGWAVRDPRAFWWKSTRIHIWRSSALMIRIVLTSRLPTSTGLYYVTIITTPKVGSWWVAPRRRWMKKGKMNIYGPNLILWC